jgi:hypothetical protein
MSFRSIAANSRWRFTRAGRRGAIRSRLECLENRLLLAYDFNPIIELGDPVRVGTAMSSSAIAEDGSNNLIVAGTFSGSINLSPIGPSHSVSSTGTSDGFLAKYAVDGSTVWAWHYGVAGQTSSANAVVTDSAGNVIVVGSYGGGLIVQKHDGASGQVDWTRVFDAGVGNGVAVDGNGDVYVVGTFSDSITLTSGASPLMGHGTSSDIFVVKLAGATGATDWGTDLGGSFNDSGVGIAVDSNLDAYIVGQYGVALNLDSIYLAKLNPNGSLAWSNEYHAPSAGPTTALDSGAGVAVDAEGDPYLYGYFDGTVSLSPGAVTSINSGAISSQFVLKVDPSGHSIWATNLNERPDSFAGGIVVDGEDNTYVASDIESTVSSPTQFGLFEAKLGPSGAVSASQTYGLDTFGPTAGGIALNDVGTVAISANYQHAFTMGTATVPVVQDGGDGILIATSLAPKTIPQITWPAPTAIPYGTALGAEQLDATANVPGTFTYTPAAGTQLGVGNQQSLVVIFTPTDAVDYTVAISSTTINVIKATPTIGWPEPADITYGTALGASQLDASASVSGTFTYGPAVGAVLSAGSDQLLTVFFTPTDTTDYNPTSASTTINVSPVTPSITWAPPAPIVDGTPLGAGQLDATANVLGTFTYSPAAGAILGAGIGEVLTASFTPTNAVDYSPVSASTTIDVSSSNAVTTWGPLANFVYTPDVPQMRTITKQALAAVTSTIHSYLAFIKSSEAQFARTLKSEKSQLKRDEKNNQSAVASDQAFIQTLEFTNNQLSSASRALSTSLLSEQAHFKKLEAGLAKSSSPAIMTSLRDRDPLAVALPTVAVADPDVSTQGLTNLIGQIGAGIAAGWGVAMTQIDSEWITHLNKSPEIQVVGDQKKTVINLAQDQETVVPVSFAVKNDSSSLFARQITALITEPSDADADGDLAGKITLEGHGPASTNQAFDLPDNHSEELTFLVDTTKLSVGPHEGVITIADSKIPANKATYTVDVNIIAAARPSTDLAVQTEQSAPTIQSQQTETYKFIYTNISTPQSPGADSPQAEMTMTIPAGIAITTISSTKGTAVLTNGELNDPGGGTIVLLDPLKVNEMVTVTVVCQAIGNGSTETAQVTGTIAPYVEGPLLGGGIDPNPANNSSTVETTINTPAPQSGLLGTWTGTYSGIGLDNGNETNLSGTVTLNVTAATVQPGGGSDSVAGTLSATGFFGLAASGPIAEGNTKNDAFAQPESINVSTVYNTPATEIYFGGSISGNSMTGTLTVTSGDGTKTLNPLTITLTKK